MTRHPMMLVLLTVVLGVGTLRLMIGPLSGPPPATAAPESAPVGLSLFVQNGQMAPLTLVGTAPRYVQEVDIVVTTPTTPTDQGLTPLIQQSALAGLHWHGVQHVEDDWRPEVDTTWTLQRFYRGAHWMEQPSHFAVTP